MKKICLALILLLQCSAAGADTSSTVDAYFRYLPKAGAKDMEGGVEILQAAADYSYEFKLFDKLPVVLALQNSYIGIENTTNVELPSHLVGLTNDIETTLPFFKFNNTYLRVGISPSFFGDDWDFETSDFRIPVRSFLIYRPNEVWTFLAGVAFYPDFEREVLPILGFIYKPNDRLTLNIVPKRPNVSYVLNERITLFVEGGGSFNSEYEVKKDNLESAVLRYKESHLDAGIKFKVNKFTEAAVAVGAAFNRSFKYRDSLGKVNLDEGLFTEFRLLIRI